MLREILEQPDVVGRLLESAADSAKQVALLAKARSVKQIVLVARGTSDHAAIYGQYLFQTENRIPAFLATPSVVTLYDGPVVLPDSLVIGISQSGRAQDVMEYMAAARAGGSPVVAITNEPNSAFGDLADVTIGLGAGVEKSVAATKTYTASLAALALISAMLKDTPEALHALDEAPGLITSAVEASKVLPELALHSAVQDECFVIGRGLNYSTALETALKIMETCYIRARAYSSADFLHGPVAAAMTVPCIVYVPQDRARHAVVEVAMRLFSQGTPLMVVACDTDSLRLGVDSVAIPYAKSSWLDPLAQIVIGQRLAYHLSVGKGLNPDAPRGLTKVTVTV
ncbi:MAG: SIS domain-containing protein [Armatimonadota bacterium]